MKISAIVSLLSAEVCSGENQLQRDVASAYAGDLLSDVLTLTRQPDVLLTSLLNPQVIRTAEMLDTCCVVFVRGKMPTDQIKVLAEARGICILTTSMQMYQACGLLLKAGLFPVE